MTTIAYRSGILAADRLMTAHTHRDGYVTKIAKNKQFLASVVGTWVHGIKFLDWFNSGMPKDWPPHMGDEKDGATGTIYCPDGLVLRYGYLGWTKRTLLPEARYYADGSGADYVYGAFSMGATAEQAVKAALIHETCSGGPIDTLSHYL